MANPRIIRPPRPPRDGSAIGLPESKIPALTQAFREYLTAVDRRDVESLAETGRRLAEIRAAIPHGQWGTWLESEVPFTPRSAEMSIQVHYFRLNQPQLFDRVAPLGRSKLYLMMRLAPERIRSLLDAPIHRLPNGVEKPLDRMTFNELKDVVAGKKPQPEPGERLARSFRRRARGLIRNIRLLIQTRPHIPTDLLEDPFDDLEEALARLASAFALSSG